MENEGRESLPIENLGEISISNNLLDNNDTEEKQQNSNQKKCSCK